MASAKRMADVERRDSSALMTESFDAPFILSEYQKLEPGESDAWNPLKDDFELLYRLSIFYVLTKALRLSKQPVEFFRVLDVGCGNGRSLRTYLDLGLKPEQLTGVDLRPNAVTLAKKLNPAVRYEHYTGNTLPFTDNCFNWINVSAVFSSIKDRESRNALVNLMGQKLTPGGYIFYCDLCRANTFAGGELIGPKALFSGYKTVWHSPIKSVKFIPLGEKFKNFINVIQKKDKNLTAFKHWGQTVRQVTNALRGKNEYDPISRSLRSMIHHLNPFSWPTHEVLLVQKMQV